MDYGKLIKDALVIAWQKRYLWAFGFFAGAGLPNLNNRIIAGKAAELIAWLVANPGGLLALLLSGLAVLLIFGGLRIISYGSLVAGVADSERKISGSLETALASGLKNFWRILGLSIIFFTSIVLVLAFLLLPFFLMMIGSGSGMKAAGILWLALMALPALAALLWACLFRDYSLCFLILEDLNLRRSLAEAWRLMKQKPAESFLLLIISLGMGLAIAIATTAALAVLSLPFIFIGLLNKTLGLLLGLFCGIPLFVLITCVFGVYGSAYWTLGYLRLRASATL